jgi:ATP-dependent Clp endopeptidase proteolytic subunit ClpP
MPKDSLEWMRLLKGTLADDDDNNSTVEFLLSEPIGFDPSTYDGMSAKYFGSVLASIPKRKKFRLMVNCPGGQCHDGTAMYNMLRARPNTESVVIGIAASMASVLMLGAEKRAMCKGTMVMIHNPMGGFNGSPTADEMEEQAKALRMLKSNMIDIYAARTKLGKKKLSDMMDETTFMTAEEALEYGFIDEIHDGGPVAMMTMNAKSLYTTCRQLVSAPKCAVGDESGLPASTVNKTKSMKLLTAQLAKLGLVSSAELTDETAILNEVNTRFAPINTAASEVVTLRTKVQAHEAALKARVETKVQKAIDAKLIKAERKDSLISAGIANEATLDFIDDLQAPSAPAPKQRPGVPPIPAKAEGSAEEQLVQIRAEMTATTDPKKLGELATKARELRGHGSMFSKPRGAFARTLAEAAAAAVEE